MLQSSTRNRGPRNSGIEASGSSRNKLSNKWPGFEVRKKKLVDAALK